MKVNKRVVIKNTSIVDVENLRVEEGKTIVMEHGKFSWIGNEGDFEKEEQDLIFDGTEKYAIPGLFDMHVHLNLSHSDLQNFGQNILRRKESYADLLAVKHVKQYLKVGVTTIRGCGGRNSLASLRQLVDEGKLMGPRMKLALNSIGQPGNQEYFGTDAMIDAIKEKAVVSGPDGVRHAVRMRKGDGADHIKTMTTGGVVHGKTSDVNQVLWADDELEAMVTEAERIGMYVAAHAHATAGINAAVRAGVRTIEHSTILDEETINLMLKKGTYITPTLSAGTFIYHMPTQIKKGLPPEMIAKWEVVSAKMVESHKLAYQKGVPLTLGTDAPVAASHGHTNKEMNLMQKELEMEPLEVIKSGTIISAEAMKMGDALGSISTGKYADIVLLDQDPSADLSFLADRENFNMVFKGGKLVAEKGRLHLN